MRPFPPEPEPTSDRQATADIPTRYEDIAQDGRVKLAALPHGLGQVCWMKLLRRHPIAWIARSEGIVPILSRLVVEGGDGPVSVRRALEGRGCYRLAHTVDAAGEVDRIILELWVDVHGRAGRTHGPPPDNAGERLRVGRVYAEHVFTRPFAPAAERKVRSLPASEDLPEVPEHRHEWMQAPELLALPTGATALDAGPEIDGRETVFGLTHTDSNQHVNSLEFPRLFEEAALRRLAGLGRRPGAQLVRWVDLRYRKPCFAGDSVQVSLQAFELDGRLGAAASLVPAGEPEGRAYCYAQMLF